MKHTKDRRHLRDSIIFIPVFFAIAACTAWLFYDSFYAILVAVPLFPFFMRAVNRIKDKKEKEELTGEFLHSLTSISASLSAGLSPENAFITAASDMEKLYGRRSRIYRELTVINSQVAMGERIGDALNEFAKRVKIPEIYDFAVVFSVAKEKGADFSSVISSCAAIMESKRQAENDARVLIRAKQYEQRVMCIIPPGIIAYLRISSGSFTDVLYHNALGVVIMSAGLVVYITSIVLSEKIGDVSV